MRRAAGDVVGKTVAAQVRQAARHLDYAADDWRVREAWYGRAGGWSAAALDELRARAAAYQKRMEAQFASSSLNLAKRLEAMRNVLTDLQDRFGELENDLLRVSARGETEGSENDV